MRSGVLWWAAAGGYTLGGGHSPLSRSLGYAVDNLLEAQVVFSDGSIATATGAAAEGLLTFYFNKFAPWNGSEHKELEAAVNWARSKQVPFTITNKTDFWDYEKDLYDPPIVRAYMANTLLQPGQAREDFRAFMREQLFVGVARDLWIACTGALLGVTSLSCGLSLGDAESGVPLLNQTTDKNELIEYFQTFAKGIRK
ncbi:hypothetical protein MAR_014928 [Mya arenaria]|uniref:Uncharacterized protein n=1 Tax=Mya arenaria TaxID=6604 RepID=A0ABY7FHX4_MYAAR|nr:hypothetical protein MAR_014928 [Mya arenaria]